MFRRYRTSYSCGAPSPRIVVRGLTHEINEVILGNVVGPGGNIARLSALEAGLPLSVTGMTIDRQCSAGLEAIRTACHFIQGGREVVISRAVWKVPALPRSLREPDFLLTV